MKRQTLFAAGILMLLAVAAFAVVRLAARSEAGDAAAAVPPVPVHAAMAERVDLAEPFEVGGDVRARTTATVVSRIVGEVRDIRAVPGDRVRAGQPIIVLDSRELSASEAGAKASLAAARQAIDVLAAERQAAEASLALARATHGRISELRAKNSATPHELDEAVAGLRGAEARLATVDARRLEADAQVAAARAAADAAAVNQSYSLLTAPFDGVVTDKLVEIGNTAAPGMPLMRLEDTRGFRLEVRLDESRVGLVQPGQAVSVKLDSSDGAQGEIAGRVSEIARAVDAGSHAFLVKIELPGGAAVRSGMFGRARFSGLSHRALAIPASSLVRRGQLTSVFVVGPDGKARMRLVTTGEPAAGRIEVRAGLDEGERVIVDPPAALVDGSTIVERQGR